MFEVQSNEPTFLQGSPKGASEVPGPVLYWMQAAQRVHHNPALYWAMMQALKLQRELRVVFCLAPAFAGAGLRQYWFMMEGIREVAGELAKLSIGFDCLVGEPGEVLGPWIAMHKPSVVVFDRGYLHIQRTWRTRVLEYLGTHVPQVPVAEVETEAVVPIGKAYPKQAWSAATLRPHLQRLVPSYLTTSRLPWTTNPRPSSFHPPLQGGQYQCFDPLSITGPKDLLELIPRLDVVVGVSETFRGGWTQAKKRLDHFLEYSLGDYGTKRSDPSAEAASGLSPYLHFGQISSLEIILETLHDQGPYSLEHIQGGTTKLFDKAVPDQGLQGFLEELVVRRGLAQNYCWYNPRYHEFQSLPAWALATLNAHRSDPRPWVYDRGDLEQARTHDPYWNACQTQMVQTGHMHGYMRMYWGKKVIEWSKDPETAWDTLAYLNDRWELDGRDPNGWAGIAWCFGLHDRPWQERPIFGTIRYMNAGGLERKFDMAPYVKRWLR